MADRLVAIPDTDGELRRILGDLEEILLSLVWREGDDDWDPEPGTVDDGAGLAALQRISGLIRTAERSEPSPQQFAPDGHFDLVPLRFVRLAEDDLAALGAAIAELGNPNPRDPVAETLRIAAGYDVDEQRALVTSFARAHGLLDLQPDADTELLANVVEAAAGRVVLTPAQYAAYSRFTDRVLALFHSGDRLAVFLYRGWPADPG